MIWVTLYKVLLFFIYFYDCIVSTFTLICPDLGRWVGRSMQVEGLFYYPASRATADQIFVIKVTTWTGSFRFVSSLINCDSLSLKAAVTTFSCQMLRLFTRKIAALRKKNLYSLRISAKLFMKLCTYKKRDVYQHTA